MLAQYFVYNLGNMKLKLKIISVFVVILGILTLTCSDVLANQELIPDYADPNNPSKTVKETGNYQVNDFVKLAVNIASWVLLLSGSLALLAFVVGGFMFVFSAGNPEWVKKGRDSILYAAIGLAVVFLAYTGINYFMKSMGYDSGAFGGEWYQTSGQ